MRFKVRAATFFGGLLVALLLVVPATTASAARNMSLGIVDLLLQDANGGTQSTWWDKAKSAGADSAKLHFYWSGVASTKPKNPRDPNDPAYYWDRYDDSIRNANKRNMDVILDVSGAPKWAEGKNRPKDVPAGTWKPDAKALGDFMYAVAKRYSGNFKDRAGVGLPKVEYIQVWNEPNIQAYLTPQWNGKKPAAPELYKKMLNESYEAVHKANKHAKVVTAGTSPYGDDPGKKRMRPLSFWRQVFCLNSKNKRTKCKKPARFDVLAHNPINTSGPPTKPASNKDDISSADMGRLAKTLHAAEKQHTIGGPKKHPLWASEIWYPSNPPEPKGYSLATQARYIEQTIYLMWKAGVSRTIVYTLRDRTGTPPYPWDSDGLYFINNDPKPALTAYEFPFVADKKGKKLFVWGMAPKSGKVKIEFKPKGGGNWKTVGSAKAKGRVFTKTIKKQGKGELRASVGGRNSLGWDLGG